MTADQLVLFIEATNGTTNGTDRKTVAELGLARDAAPGPERLLRELVRRGLDREHLPAAAALALALDAPRRNGKR